MKYQSTSIIRFHVFYNLCEDIKEYKMRSLFSCYKMFDSAIHTVKLRKSDRSAVLLMNLRFFRHEKNWVYLGLVVRISQNMKRIFWKLSSASKSSLVVTIETPKIRYVLQVYFIRPQTAVHRSKVPIDTRLNVVIQSLLVTPIITPITNIEPNSLI